jgi:hypothetical protein
LIFPLIKGGPFGVDIPPANFKQPVAWHEQNTKEQQIPVGTKINCLPVIPMIMMKNGLKLMVEHKGHPYKNKQLKYPCDAFFIFLMP